eukprot:TRINITY_DN5855_c0_g1_i1.p4 TRINITY_DN5855_c0_g1~~TRINITY_DN5855_c0_g1_i1.p4  ORF type:complete len:121 (+),score=3.14 TRINITY_DN5855_c0_g1_i1:661-1023(+)
MLEMHSVSKNFYKHKSAKSPKQNAQKMFTYKMLPQVFFQKVLRHSAYYKQAEQCQNQKRYLFPTQMKTFFCLLNVSAVGVVEHLSLIHISEPTRLGMISYAVFCLKKKKKTQDKKNKKTI